MQTCNHCVSTAGRRAIASSGRSQVQRTSRGPRHSLLACPSDGRIL